MASRESRLLEIEAARIRHAWAKSEVDRKGATIARTELVKALLEDWRALVRKNAKLLARLK
jgi:hypothetical protein